MNLYLYGYGPPEDHDWIVVDVGVRFADESLPGIDLTMADPAFLEQRRDRLKGIVLTHGHEDHIGALVHLWPKLQCPVYATPFTGELLREKINEAHLDGILPLEIVPLGGRFPVGPFEVELIALTHSIPEPNALALRTPAGTVLHTGDWKLDADPVLGAQTDEHALRALGEEGVVAMICDSTNVLSDGASGSEALVRDSLVGLIGELKGRVAVTTFASNAGRLDSIARAAVANGRNVVLAGRAMHRIVRAAKATGYLKDFPETVAEDEAGYLPPEKTLILCTGSQAESRAALARMAEDTHPSLALGDGDTVIFSSKIIPGNERGIFQLQNRLASRGIHVLTERDHFVHVSGHPCRDELAKMYEWVRPRNVVPMHGETRHLLEHVDFATQHGADHAVMAVNGTVVRLAPGRAEIIGEIPQGKLLLDGKVLVPEDAPAVKTRRRLAEEGMVHVTLIFDKHGELMEAPIVLTMGIPDELAERDETIDGDLSERAEAAVEALSDKQVRDDGAVEETARRAIRRMLKSTWGKRPPVEVDIVRLPV
ncbi:MAG: ribonuclease J [Alphaproteobacteria bacterium]